MIFFWRTSLIIINNVSFSVQDLIGVRVQI